MASPSPRLGTAGLISAGFEAVHRLDDAFGKPHKTVMSQRDVPGLTRGIVPLMQDAGVLAFSEGCNAQITPPEVPGPVFNWTDRRSSASALFMIHPRGYGLSLGDQGGDDEGDGGGGRPR